MLNQKIKIRNGTTRLLEYYANLQDSNSLTNKLRKQYSNFSLTGLLKHLGK